MRAKMVTWLEGLDLLIQRRMHVGPGGLAAVEAADMLNLRQAMFTNLRGMVALEEGDDGKAARFFEEALKIRSSFTIAALNLAFVRIHQDRYQDAIDLMRQLIETGALKDDPRLLGSAYTIWGVGSWGVKNVNDAATQFRNANQADSHATMANLYWSEMLDHAGDTAEAIAKRRLAIESTKYFTSYAETAIFFFRLTPQDHMPLTKL